MSSFLFSKIEQESGIMKSNEKSLRELNSTEEEIAVSWDTLSFGNENVVEKSEVTNTPQKRQTKCLSSYTEKINSLDIENRVSISSTMDTSNSDVLLREAGRYIINSGKVSIGSLQRFLGIGFNRTAKLIDQLSEIGVIGEADGNKPRLILMDLDEFERRLEVLAPRDSDNTDTTE